MRNGIIWMLHRVAPAVDKPLIFKLDKSLRISPDFLEEQILKAQDKGYRFVSLDEFLQNKHQGRAAEKDIVVTIDDGFRDVYQYAFPVFKKHHIPFVFYVASDLIKYGFDRCALPEMDGALLLMDVLRNNSFLKVAGGGTLIATPKQKQKAFGRIWRLFSERRQTSSQGGREILQSILSDKQLDFRAYFNRCVCHPEDLKEMADSDLCTIGSHAKSHVFLTNIKDTDALTAELSESQAEIEKWIGRKVEHFSYPYGQCNNEIKELARKYYKSAVAIALPDKRRRWCDGGDDNYALPRVSVQENRPFSSFIGRTTCLGLLKILLSWIYKKERMPNGNRNVYLFGCKICSYAHHRQG